VGSNNDSRLKCFVFSDIHLNSYLYHHEGYDESPRQKNFRRFLDRIHADLLPDDELLIVLNGDIFDINESWLGSPEPWSEDETAVEATYLQVLREILDSNTMVLEGLQILLNRTHTKIVYVIGNHDYLLGVYPSGQELVRQRLFGVLPTEQQDSQKLRFTEAYQNDRLELYVEHGHKLDPFNSYNFTHFPPLGEIINVAIVNKLHPKVLQRVAHSGYTAPEIALIKQRLKDIEYLRPLALFPLWIEEIDKQLASVKNRPPIAQVVRDCLMEIMDDRHILAFFVQKLKLPAWLLRFLASLALNNPSTLPVMSYVVSKCLRQNHSNNYQYQKAVAIHQHSKMALIVFGHTHHPSSKPIGNSGYYFNTGSWKPVINHVKSKKRLPFDEQFVKVEHWGVLRIEKKQAPFDAKTEYFLETVNNGYID